MLDIKLIRDNLDVVRKGLQNRGGRFVPDLEKAVQKDKEWRAVLAELEDLRARRNKSSDEIGKLKKEKKDAASLMKEVEEIKIKLKEKEDLEKKLSTETEALLLGLPNIPDASVPVGKSAEDNKVVREGKKTSFSFKAKDHHELGVSLGIFVFETATKISGARFSMYVGAGARLERAISNFMLDLHTKEHGYTEILPPYLVTGKR